jgi:hypothetical protein
MMISNELEILKEIRTLLTKGIAGQLGKKQGSGHGNNLSVHDTRIATVKSQFDLLVQRRKGGVCIKVLLNISNNLAEMQVSC